jgi:hypothetical protein
MNIATTTDRPDPQPAQPKWDETDRFDDHIENEQASIENAKEIDKQHDGYAIEPKHEPEVKKPEPPKHLMVDKPLLHHRDSEFAYPFADLDVGKGFFVANEDVKGDNLERMRKLAFQARNHYSIVEHDINGDEVWENVIIRGRQRTGKSEFDANGSVVNEFHRDATGNPVQTASEESRPKRIYSRHFSVRSVDKDEVIGDGDMKADRAGVLVIREA